LCFSLNFFKTKPHNTRQQKLPNVIRLWEPKARGETNCKEEPKAKKSSEIVDFFGFKVVAKKVSIHSHFTKATVFFFDKNWHH